MRVGLVSCVKSKLPTRARARDLYVSPLFKGMRAYVERNCDEWIILSAQHGALRPGRIVEPYDKTLLKMPVPERKAWAQLVQRQLLKMLPAQSEIVVLAGERYRADLVPFLSARHHAVNVPLAGKRLGAQLAWLKEQSK